MGAKDKIDIQKVSETEVDIAVTPELPTKTTRETLVSLKEKLDEANAHQISLTKIFNNAIADAADKVKIAKDNLDQAMALGLKDAVAQISPVEEIKP